MRFFHYNGLIMLESTHFSETSFCPHRVCPLGAHVDHQYGLVTGFALDRGITFRYEPSKTVCLESRNFPGTKKFSLYRIPPKKGNWGDYLRGATLALGSRYELTTGVTGVFEGSMPIGGLSSSAALILSYLSALCRVNSISISQHDLIYTAFEAESSYVGVHVGTLDQSCEVYSKANHLLSLDTQDDSFELIPQPAGSPSFEIAVFFSGLERSLAGSAFNVRVDETKAAAYALKGWAGMESGKFADARLRDVPIEIFERYRGWLPENWRKRAVHFYGELDRVRKGVAAWRSGNLTEFGAQTFASGKSSIEQYETGSAELKRLYELMLETPGIYGGRFSGAGFKGCCMALIDPAFREEIADRIKAGYLKTFPHLQSKYAAYFCKTGDGLTLN